MVSTFSVMVMNAFKITRFILTKMKGYFDSSISFFSRFIVESFIMESMINGIFFSIEP